MFRESIAKFFKVDNLISNVAGFVETKIELIKVEVKEELAKSLSKAIFYLLLFFVFALFVIFFSTAVAWQLSTRLGTFWGFTIVAGFYIVAGGIILGLQKPIIANLEKKLNDLFASKK